MNSCLVTVSSKKSSSTSNGSSSEQSDESLEDYYSDDDITASNHSSSVVINNAASSSSSTSNSTSEQSEFSWKKFKEYVPFLTYEQLLDTIVNYVQEVFRPDASVKEQFIDKYNRSNKRIKNIRRRKEAEYQRGKYGGFNLYSSLHNTRYNDNYEHCKELMDAGQWYTLFHYCHNMKDRKFQTKNQMKQFCLKCPELAQIILDEFPREELLKMAKINRGRSTFLKFQTVEEILQHIDAVKHRNETPESKKRRWISEQPEMKTFMKSYRQNRATCEFSTRRLQSLESFEQTWGLGFGFDVPELSRDEFECGADQKYFDLYNKLASKYDKKIAKEARARRYC